VTVTLSLVSGALSSDLVTATIPVGQTMFYDSLGVRVVGVDTVSSGDAYFDIARGTVSGFSAVHKFGRNDAVPNGSWERVAFLSIPTAFNSSASTVRIKAGGNANDDAAGTHAREVTVQGLDDTGAVASSAIATAGASASSATTISYWRIFRAWVSSAGGYGNSNAATITIEDSGGAADLVAIGTGEGQSFYGGYSIPLAKTGYIKTIAVTVDSNKAADFRLFKRDSFTDTSVPVEAYRAQLEWLGLTSGLHNLTPATPMGPYSALTDLWFESRGSGGTAAVSVDFEVLLEDD
jgi:hypothetical protein